MNKVLFAASLSVLSMSLTLPAKAADPCTQVLCLFGVVSTGKVQSGCKSAVAGYFSIQDFSHGSFLPDHTQRSRKSKVLDKCPSADSGKVQEINDKLGRLRGL